MQYWEITIGESETDGAVGYPVFGVRVTLEDGGVWAWPDVDTDRAVVAELVRRLQITQPQTCHFRDVVLDYIEEQAQKV